MENFIQLAKDRYSVRKFTPGEIPAQDIEKILEAGRLAPTAVNFQPFFFWVFRGESKQKLLECTKMKFIGDADVIIAVGSKADGAWVRPFDQKNFSEVDAAIATTHMMLAIHDLGYGSTWIGHFDPEKVHELFPETVGWELNALLPVGIISSEAEPSDRHDKRKSGENLIRYYD